MNGALRLSYGRFTTLEDIDYLLQILPGIVEHASVLDPSLIPRGNDMIYSDILQDHFENPRNIGTIDQADAEAEVENPACGDIMHLYLRIENDRIVEAKFQTQGCPPAIAAGSITPSFWSGAL